MMKDHTYCPAIPPPGNLLWFSATRSSSSGMVVDEVLQPYRWIPHHHTLPHYPHAPLSRPTPLQSRSPTSHHQSYPPSTQTSPHPPPHDRYPQHPSPRHHKRAVTQPLRHHLPIAKSPNVLRVWKVHYVVASVSEKMLRRE